MKIFEFNDYKKFVNDWIESQPNGGRGLLSRMAEKLGVHTTLLSHTLRGDKDMSIEQAFATCEFLGLTESETDYFILMVQVQRAGTSGLKKKFERDLRKLKTKSQDISTRVPTDIRISDTDSAQFYSSWIYAAVRQLSSIPEFQSRSKLLEEIDLPREVMNKVLEFLLRTGLCIENGGKILIGPSRTHLDSKSPQIWMHHKNWRLKGFEKHPGLSDDELMYSAPFTVSENDFLKFREKVVQLIQELVQIADSTQPEKLACFNVDLFYAR